MKRVKALLLSAMMILSLIPTSMTAFAAEVPMTTETEYEVVETKKLENGVTATTISFEAEGGEGIHSVTVPAESSSDVRPYLWRQESISSFSSGQHWGAYRTFDEGDYLGYEVSVTALGSTTENQWVEVYLYPSGVTSYYVGYAVANTKQSSPNYKADWIDIVNGTEYRFWYYSPNVSSANPVRVTITYYTWD